MSWPNKRLGDVCEIVMGQSPAGESYNTSGEGVPLINGPVEFSREAFGKTIRSKFTTQPTKFCKEGDLILCVRGSTTGRMNIAGFDACIGRGVASIRAIEYQPWINHFVSSIRDEIHGTGTGATFPNVSGAMLENFEVAMPTLPEQRRIVAILDEAFEGIATAKANAENNVQNARALFESHLESVFTQRDDGWTLKKLGDLATFRNGINFTKSSRGDTVKIVGVRDFQKDFWAPLDSLDTVTTDGLLPESDMLKEHDLLFVRSNGNKELIGRCLLVGPVDTRITHSGFTIRARLNDDGVKPEYLCHFLKSNKAKREMIDSGAGANISSLNQTTLAGLVIPFPSVAAQGLIVQQIQTVAAETQRLESIYQQKLAALDELKKSLLNQAFSGKL